MPSSPDERRAPRPAEADGELDGLLAGAAAGDRAALGVIYERYRRVVHGIVVARAGTRDAEDLVQEVFAVLCRRAHTIEGGASLGAWLAAVARNVATDALRRRMRRPAHEPLGEEPAGPGPDGVRELRRRVLAHVRSLPEAYRETLILRLVEGLTGPEIAARTGLTHGSVRVNLSRGMGMLRPLLEKEGWP